MATPKEATEAQPAEEVAKKRKTSRFDIMCLKTLATTNFGKVKLAKVCSTDTLVVVKMSSLKKIRERKLVENPLTEAKILAQLTRGSRDHPGYKHVTSFFKETITGGYHCLAMEYVPGGELFGDILNAGAQSETTAKYYLRQILYGVDYIHSSGFCHLDLKLENILVTASGYLKICDFGAATTCTPRDCSTPLNSRVGTVSYMASEVYQCKPYNGFQADVYSLGVMLFLLITGSLPYDQPTQKDPRFCLIYSGHLRELLGMWRIALSDQVLDLLEHMLCPPAKRYRSVRQVLAHPWFERSMKATKQMDAVEKPAPVPNRCCVASTLSAAAVTTVRQL